MLYLRLARGYRFADLGRWLLTATAAALVAALLLRALGRALTDPAAGALVRLLWCLPPLVAVAWFAAVAARAVPAGRPDRITGLTAAGAGPSRIRALIAGETALACCFGSAVTLLLFLVLRNDVAGPSLAPELGMGAHLPAAAPVTLLALVPLVAGLSAALAVPALEALPGRPAPAATPRFGALRLALPAGLLLTGLALELYGLRPGADQDGRPVKLPAGLGSTSPAALIGWALAALGLFLLTAPALAWAGRLLSLGRPAPIRLLAGRGLTAEARRLGTPLAVLALALAAVLTTFRYWFDRPGTAAPLPAVECLLVLCCVVGAVLVRAAEIRSSRRPVIAALTQLGAAPRLLFGAALLRAATAGTVLLLTGGLTAALAAGALR
ncbi:hypothetical protein CFP65_5177 [Kitasatospora sp. MMS16-BH015]|uniref:hypothetical protein n=1 Tax=Kitasatospora sp. MMS16-BH015 TaxID=2018025 RepID=UPI000CA22F7A|nr:hypothetical protein [Kitasatospora sp. MMS16-BH015]AUG79887.1 hypothetical protein CFP65_5177 [Kitasatospora sp. MMS16-BH015]